MRHSNLINAGSIKIVLFAVCVCVARAHKTRVFRDRAAAPFIVRYYIEIKVIARISPE